MSCLKPSMASRRALGRQLRTGAVAGARTHMCGDLREGDVGCEVELRGWIESVRDMGGLAFADVRDHKGKVQVVGEEGRAKEQVERLREEWVVAVSGVARERKSPNRLIPTGQVEIVASEVRVLNRVGTPLPMGAGSSEGAQEATRLENRFIDLRRDAMQRNLRLRHGIIKAARRLLEDQHSFLEVETPCLTAPTPEGARDFLVPSRLSRGSAYALPQSPQLYKQLLMAAGVDRYFQVAKCFRDEDFRADRQPEFTQLDLEMSFASSDDVIAITEQVVRAAFMAADKDPPSSPFPRLDYREAIATYGSDSPDLRYPSLRMADISSVATRSSFRALAGPAEQEGCCCKCLRVPASVSIPNKRLRAKDGDLVAEAMAAGAGGLAHAKIANDDCELEGQKALVDGFHGLGQELCDASGAATGDLLLMAAGPKSTVNASLDRVRRLLCSELEPETNHAVCWVTGFPLFEEDSESGRLEPVHHPFTAPESEREDMTVSDILTARSSAYDLVCDGVELGGGSVRISDKGLQMKALEAAGVDSERFSFLLRALDSGCPPHAGLALGLDRLVAILAGERSIRDVIAFPKAASGAEPLSGAPSPLEPSQLAELGLSVSE